MILRIRTRIDLMKLLADSKSGEWRMSHKNIDKITHVEIYNFEGDLVLSGKFDKSNTTFNEIRKRFTVAFTDGALSKANFKWVGQNPIQYEHDEEVVEEDEVATNSESTKSRMNQIVQDKLEYPVVYKCSIFDEFDNFDEDYDSSWFTKEYILNKLSKFQKRIEKNLGVPFIISIIDGNQKNSPISEFKYIEDPKAYFLDDLKDNTSKIDFIKGDYPLTLHISIITEESESIWEEEFLELAGLIEHTRIYISGEYQGEFIYQLYVNDEIGTGYIWAERIQFNGIEDDYVLDPLDISNVNLFDLDFYLN